jgi:hypothetical protein
VIPSERLAGRRVQSVWTHALPEELAMTDVNPALNAEDIVDDGDLTCTLSAFSCAARV